MVQPLRFGLIGCGQQGREHSRGARPRCRRATGGVQRPRSGVTRRGRRRLRSVARFADFRRMLEQTRLDAVIVATTHDVLADAALAAVQTGCHVFCEKPLATSADRARPVVEAARRAGRNLMVGYIQRFDPLRQRLKHLLDGGAFGDLAYVVASKGGPGRSRWVAPVAGARWRTTAVGRLAPGGPAALAARPARRARLRGDRSARPRTGVDLTSVVTLRFERRPDRPSRLLAGGLRHLRLYRGRRRGRPRPLRVAVRTMDSRVHSRRIAEFETPRVLTQAPLTIRARLPRRADRIHELHSSRRGRRA